jgi:anti-sigma factor RsiW
MTRHEERAERPDTQSERELWRRSRLIDAPEDDAGRFLDLAAFADGLLDDDERDRVTALLAVDPDAAADVEAARTSIRPDESPAELEKVVPRASAIVPDAALPYGRVVPFISRRRGAIVQYFAQWGSIAAAIVLAGWLGFSMGSDTSLALSNSRQSTDAILPELFDQTSGFLRDLGEGLRT